MRVRKPDMLHLAVVCLAVLSAATLATGCERRPTDPSRPGAPPAPVPSTSTTPLPSTSTTPLPGASGASR